MEFGFEEVEDIEKEKASAFKTIHTLTILARAHQGGEVPVVDEFSKIIKDFSSKETSKENTGAFTKAIWQAMTSKGSMSESMESMVDAAGGFDKVIQTMRDPKKTPFKGKDRKKAKKFVTTSVLTMVDMMFGDDDDDDDGEEDETSGDEGEGSDDTDDDDME